MPRITIIDIKWNTHGFWYRTMLYPWRNAFYILVNMLLWTWTRPASSAHSRLYPSFIEIQYSKFLNMTKYTSLNEWSSRPPVATGWNKIFNISWWNVADVPWSHNNQRYKYLYIYTIWNLWSKKTYLRYSLWHKSVKGFSKCFGECQDNIWCEIISLKYYLIRLMQ